MSIHGSSVKTNTAFTVSDESRVLFQKPGCLLQDSPDFSIFIPYSSSERTATLFTLR